MAKGKMDVTAETLSGLAAFRDLDAGDRGELARHCQGWRYAAGQRIVSHKDEGRDVFFVVSGRVRATLYAMNGRTVTFQDLEAGEMFGELSAIDGQLRSMYVLAVEDVAVVSMGPQSFRETLRKYPSIADSTLERLTRLVRFLCGRVFEFSTLHVRDRVHVELLRLAQEHLQDGNVAVISPPPNHADIASRIDTHREGVTRALNKMAREGLIERRASELVVPDVAALERVVHGVLGL